MFPSVSMVTSGCSAADTSTPMLRVSLYMSLKRLTGLAMSGRQFEEHLPQPTQDMKPNLSNRYLPFLKYLCLYLVGLVGRKFSPEAILAKSSRRHPSHVLILSPCSSERSGLSLTSKQ